ncbi:hypothetical protein J6590_100644, partial [Homalodisca vitripennis]
PNMGSYGREKFPHFLEKSLHVREKFPAHTLILVFWGDLGCQNRYFSVKSVICWVLTLPVREKRGTEGIPIWRRWREKLAGTGEPNLTFFVSRVFKMAAPMMNWREQGNLTSLSWFPAYPIWLRP